MNPEVATTKRERQLPLPLCLAEARKGFYRELKIVLVAALMFHFLVVPTFIVPAEAELSRASGARLRMVEIRSAFQVKARGRARELTLSRSWVLICPKASGVRLRFFWHRRGSRGWAGFRPHADQPVDSGELFVSACSWAARTAAIRPSRS